MKTGKLNKPRVVMSREQAQRPYFNKQAVERMDMKTFKNFFRYNKNTQNRIFAKVFDKALGGKHTGTAGNYIPDRLGFEIIVIVIGGLVITILVPKEPPLGLGPIIKQGREGFLNALTNDTDIAYKGTFSARDSKGFRLTKGGTFLADGTVHSLQL